MDSNAVVILVVALVVLAVLVGVALVAGKRKREQRSATLQDRFGPEYDRAVADHGDRRTAEQRLADVADRRDKAEIRDLTPAERDHYTRQWMEVQAAFVDAPAAATRDADRLVSAIMRDRGYPVDDFDSDDLQGRAGLVAVDHPQVVEHYRAAHAVGSRTEEVGTEDLRQAFVHYRALFDEMLSEGRGEPAYP